MQSEKTDIQADSIQTKIGELANEIAATYTEKPPVIIGIANGGIPFSKKLAAALGKIINATVSTGQVNVTFHRDDISATPIPPEKKRTLIHENIEGLDIILADDVIQSARTARAAMNEVFDQGRPNSIRMAVLCDRGNRKLPIQPDFVAFNIETSANQHVKVNLDCANPNNDSVVVHTES